MVYMVFMPLYMWEMWDLTPVTHGRTDGQWKVVQYYVWDVNFKSSNKYLQIFQQLKVPTDIYKSSNNITVPTEIYKSSNNKNCTNRNLQIFQQISTNLPTNIYKSSNNKRYQQKPTSTALYWPRTTKYQLGTAYTDPVPLSINQCRPLLTQYQSVPPFTDPAPSSTNQYRPLLTQHHQVPTSTALFWPSTIKYQPVLDGTGSVKDGTGWYLMVLGQ